MAKVTQRVGEFCDMPAELLEQVLIGVVNGKIKTLRPEVAEALHKALGEPAQEGSDDMGRSAVAQHIEPVGEETARDRAVYRAPEEDEIPAAGALRGAEPRGLPAGRQEWPFPCEVEGCDQGFDTAQGLRMHSMRRHGIGGAPPKLAGSPGGRRKARKAPARKLTILEAAARAPDPETECLSVCSRQLATLKEPEAKRVLEYLAQRFVADVEPPVSRLATAGGGR